VLNTHQPQSDPLYTMRDEDEQDRERNGAQGAIVLQANKEEALVRCHSTTGSSRPRRRPGTAA
jgi:hypothetical protein